MKPRDFEAALREADGTLRSEPMPADAAARVREGGLDSGVKRFRVRPSALGYAFAGSALAIVLALVLWASAQPILPQGLVVALEPLQRGPYFVASADALQLGASEPSRVVVRSGSAVLVEPQWGGAVGVSAGTDLTREPSGLRLRAGTLRVHVRPRPNDAPPVRVLVSHGVIEVVGTTFTVRQGSRGGEVVLHEGVIRFVDAQLHATILTAGSTLRWPRTAALPARPTPAHEAHEAPEPDARELPTNKPAPDEEPDEDPDVTPPQPAPRLAFDSEAFLHHIAVLRSRGRYDSARQEIAAALGRNLAASTHERLSFELGTLLTRHLNDNARACAHWRAHELRHPRGRYDRELREAKQQLGCD